jgi:hypothetical protein
VVRTLAAFEAIKETVQRDMGYAWVWHSNIAMACQDEGVSHEQANRAADRFMSSVFKVNVQLCENQP